MGLLDRLIRKHDAPAPAARLAPAAATAHPDRLSPPLRPAGAAVPRTAPLTAPPTVPVARAAVAADGVAPGAAGPIGRPPRARPPHPATTAPVTTGAATTAAATIAPATTAPATIAPVTTVTTAPVTTAPATTDDRPRDDRPRDDRPRDDRPRGGRRPAADRKPSFAASNATNGDRSSAAARKALSSGGYQLPPLNVVDAIDPGDYPAAFRELGLSERALAVMASLGFDSPTPIQEQSLPLMLDGHDVVGQAQTGTGKTLAFGLLIVERLDPSLRDVQAVVLVPTRELAQQVFGVLEFLAAAMGLLAVPLVGGRRLNQDFDNLERRPQIVVGTPGRIIDHLGRGTLDLREVRVAILDEADRMLDIGFEPDMRRILGRCPSDRQTALFSATIPTPIKTLIWRFMHEPEHISIEPEQAPPARSTSATTRSPSRTSSRRSPSCCPRCRAAR